MQSRNFSQGVHLLGSAAVLNNTWSIPRCKTKQYKSTGRNGRSTRRNKSDSLRQWPAFFPRGFLVMRRGTALPRSGVTSIRGSKRYVSLLYLDQHGALLMGLLNRPMLARASMRVGWLELVYACRLRRCFLLYTWKQTSFHPSY